MLTSSRIQKLSSNQGRHDLVLVARRSDPAQSAVTDLSNVVPFARRRAVEAEFPLAPIAAADRPALSLPDFGVEWRIALFTGSLMLHSLLLATFWQEPPPLASIGVESIRVEITLGATNAAGLGPQPGEQEVEPVTTAEENRPDALTAEQPRVATVMPQEIPVAAQEAAPEAIPQETPQDVEIAREQQAPIAETPEQRVQQAPERTRIGAPTEKKAVQKKQVAAVPSDSASGTGRGRSDVSSNYNGLVAAHLQRYKQYPTAARAVRSQGVATVSFTVDEFGRITSVELAHTSGIRAFDQEVVAMVRRASPFPRPPDRHSRNFTVPVRFSLR
jgi:periplasmic protein TonB